MHEDTLNADAMPDARKWVQILARYRKPSYKRGLFELAITALPLIL